MRASGIGMASGMVAPSIVVGIDLVQISAIASSIEHFGKRFLDRIYTSGEVRYCLLDPEASAMHLAARFAAKEAVRKVLGLGDEAVGWRSIEIERQPGGACAVVLHREARARARFAGFVGFSVSMTHEADFASAVVVGERRRIGRTG
jgi:holo-[acyl-carrier protein] synthase